jgi:serine/threonine-protein kinase
VGFFGQGMLSRVAMTGGPAAEIARIDGPARGATWGDDGTIVFATAGSHRGLQRVSAAGGEPQVLTRPALGEIEHVLPQFLPGARAVLFTIRRPGAPTSEVAILDLRAESPTPKILIRGGSDARYLPTGHLVYVAGDSLRVVPFDLNRLEIPDATSVPVAANIAVLGGVAGEYDVAADGTLVYLDAVGGSSAARTLVWVDRSGREQPIAAPPRAYLYPRLSPDGTRVALDVREQETDIWVWDLVRNGFTRVTKDPNLDRAPVWTADGDYIVFSGMTDGTPNVYLQRADGAGTPERITQTRRPQFPLSLSPDGSQVVLADTGETVERADLTIVRLDPSRGRDGGSAKPVEAEPLVRTAAGELNGSISPDGRWLAYQSNESGDWDVYVRPFANGRASSGIRSTVSTAGGIQPRWSHDGHELFYISRSNEMMRVHVTAGPTWSASTPQKLFDVSPYYFGAGNPYFMYDIARDGRFLMVKAPGAAKTDTSSEDHIILVQNWLEEVKRAMQAR